MQSLDSIPSYYAKLHIENRVLKTPYGTGSTPLPPQGWHLEILFIANHKPLNTPYFFNASAAYCEQVGVNLHLGPITGEIIS